MSLLVVGRKKIFLQYLTLNIRVSSQALYSISSDPFHDYSEQYANNYNQNYCFVEYYKEKSLKGEY